MNEQISSLLKSNEPREAVLEKILREVFRQFSSETGAIHRLHEPTQLLRLIAQVGLPPKM